jgi:hypothetical protein
MKAQKIGNTRISPVDSYEKWFSKSRHHQTESNILLCISYFVNMASIPASAEKIDNTLDVRDRR